MVLKKFAFGKVIIQIAVKARLKYAPILFGSLVFTSFEKPRMSTKMATTSHDWATAVGR